MNATPDAPVRRSAGARRNTASRDAILDAAFHLVGELGYARLTVEAIAARAGVGKQTIYRWWPSKGAVLLDALLARSGGADTPIALPDTGDLEADLVTVLRATAAEFANPEFSATLRALTIAVLEDRSLAERYAISVEEPTRRAKRDRLRSGQAAGQLPEAVDLELAIDLIWGPLTQRWLFGDAPLDEASAERLTRTALAGLRARV